LPALLATGACSLLATPATALQLGDLQVQSKLGQPLRASIAFALQPEERLYQHCIYLRPGNRSAGLPAITQANVSIANGQILIRGTAPVSDPIVALGLAVSCPYVANLDRVYDVMLDPIESSAAVARFTNVATTQTSAEIDLAPSASAARSAPAAAGTPIQPETTYRVQPGDSLSTIVSRIENRSLSLWPAVERLFAENPQAFIDGDVDRLKAGSVLTIPELNRVTLANSADAAGEPTVSESEAAEEALASPGEMPTSVPVAPADSVDVADVAGNNAPTSSESEVSSPVATPAASAEPAIVPTLSEPTATTDQESMPSSGLLYWLAPAGLLLIGAVSLIVGMVQKRRRRRALIGGAATADTTLKDNEATARNPAVVEVDFDMTEIAEVTAEQRAALLDANLGDGSGLEGNDDDATAEFALPTAEGGSADVDFALPAAENDEDSDDSPTDVLPANAKVTSTILESEVLPSDDDDDSSDIAAAAGATNNALDDLDITVREIETLKQADQTDADYTLDQEVDYHILEQDYEDELSATQALNNEIMRAAEELQERIRSAHADDAPSEDVPTEIDVTGQLTTELPALSPEADGQADDIDATTEITVNLEAAVNDADAELNIETGRFNINK